jgi:acetyl-CoA acetyltransferase
MHFAMPYARYLRKYGTTREQMATFIVRNRENAQLNPQSVFRGQPLTREDYLDSPLIASPMNLFDCDMPVSGCGALVLTSAERARDLRRPPVFVTGYSSLGLRYTRTAVQRLEDFMESGKLLADNLWKSSGLAPDDVDQVNVYDGFSYMVMLWLEALGFCGEGEAFDYVQGDDTALGGRQPVNTNGGALAMGRLHGTPQLIEAVRQIRGECGARQVPDAEVTLAQVGSPLFGAAAIVFSKEAS